MISNAPRKIAAPIVATRASRRTDVRDSHIQAVAALSMVSTTRSRISHPLVQSTWSANRTSWKANAGPRVSGSSATIRARRQSLSHAIMSSARPSPISQPARVRTVSGVKAHGPNPMSRPGKTYSTDSTPTKAAPVIRHMRAEPGRQGLGRPGAHRDRAALLPPEQPGQQRRRNQVAHQPQRERRVHAHREGVPVQQRVQQHQECDHAGRHHDGTDLLPAPGGGAPSSITPVAR